MNPKYVENGDGDAEVAGRKHGAYTRHEDLPKVAGGGGGVGRYRRVDLPVVHDGADAMRCPWRFTPQRCDVTQNATICEFLKFPGTSPRACTW